MIISLTNGHTVIGIYCLVFNASDTEEFFFLFREKHAKILAKDFFRRTKSNVFS